MYSQNLQFKRISTNNKLHRLRVKVPKGRNKELLPVSQRNYAIKYDVVNFFSHWIAEHLDYIDRNEGVPLAKRHTPKSSDFCDHVDKQCLNKAGFYHAIGKGGEAYLAVDEVMKKWNEQRYDANGEEEADEVRETLGEIKAEAAKIAARMAGSALHFAGKDKLEYLTCVSVKDANMPWKAQKEDVEMED